MSGTPNIPPDNSHLTLPHWRNDSEWIALVEFLSNKFEEFAWRGPKAIGYMYAYALMTHTLMLAFLIHEEDQVYEFLFFFDSQKNKKEFLRLLQANEATACDQEEIFLPEQAHIEQGRPLADVLPDWAMREVLIVSKMALPISGSIKPN